MADRIRVLDLFCGAGGAGMGYHLAWPDAHIVGVDVAPQPNYPFEFVQADAVTYPTDGFDFIHASPPCQAYTTMANRYRGKGGPTDDHHDLIDVIRVRLEQAGVPWVIENVPGARPKLPNALTLTGGMFGLGVHRPRLFASSELILLPAKSPAPDGALGVYGKLDGRRIWTRTDGSEQRAPRTLEQASEAMGIDWMTWDEIREAIPPAYTQFLAEQIVVAVMARG